MKKVVLLLAVLALCIGAFAQDKEVKEIRKLYASAMKQIEDMKGELNCDRSMMVKKHYVVPAIGPVEETMEFYAVDVADGETNPGGTDFKAFFIRVKTDAGPTSMGVRFTEYLYYPDNKTLAFYFDKSTNVYAEEPVFAEERVYFNKKGELLTSNVKVVSQDDGRVMPVDAEFSGDIKPIKDSSDRLLKGFDALMNR